MYDFSSYNHISPELLSPCTPTDRRQFQRVPTMREDPAHIQNVPAIAATTANTLQPAFLVAWLATLLHRERCADICVIVEAVIVYEGRFFLKNGALHRTSDMRKKISCVNIRFSVTTVVTTVVTIIVMR